MALAAPLVDTNVIAELSRPRPNRGVQRWAEGVSAVAISVISVEEVAFGLAWRPNARARDWFARFLEAQCEILPITSEIAQLGGELRGRFRSRGLARSQADMLIAATAQVHGLTLVTRNVRDFDGTSIGLVNPFT